MFLAISSLDDPSVPYVERFLPDKFFLLTTRDILQSKTWTYHLRNGKTEITLNGRKIRDVRSVWYRQYLLVQGFELPVAKGKQKYAQDAIRYFNRLLFAQFPEALWVSNFFAVEAADDKLRQLQVASNLGLRVPDTIITSSSKSAFEFVRRHKAAIAKPNYSARYQEGDQEYVFYTSRINESTDFSGLKLAPAIIQQAITVDKELRITVVGNSVFAASVEVDEDKHAAHIRDWRVADMADMRLAAFDLPVKIQQKCISLVKELGLQFGAIDMIVDPQGEYWFLENNPAGQWFFVEQATGLPIGKAIAGLLISGK